MSDRFGSDAEGGTAFGDGGRDDETEEGRFGTQGEGGTIWDADAIFLASLVDVNIPIPPTDGYVLVYDAVSGTWLAVAPTGIGGVDWETETISVDIDFIAQTTKDITIPLGYKARILAMGRLYIDTDPGGAFNQWATYTFYSKSTQKGADAYSRHVVKLAYTELEVGTTGIDNEITPDDHTIFGENDLARFLDDDEMVRIDVVADTLEAEDIVGVHGIDTGLARVSEFSGVTLFNNEGATTGYFRVEFASVQTVSLKMDLVVVK